MALIPINRIFHHVTGKPTRVKNILLEHFKLSEGRATELLRLGAIYSNKQRLFEDRELPKGAYLRLHLYPKRFSLNGIRWKERLLKETNDLIVINKPPGIPTHATVDNALENCLTQMRLVLGCELFVTQRLDNPVGGLLVFAKNNNYQAKFNRLLSERKLQKIYVALLEKPCPVGWYQHWMKPSERSPKVLSAEPRESWQSCELSVLRTEPLELNRQTFFQTEIDLHTGRTHQIRSQLAFMGFPVLGDRLYGSAQLYGPAHKEGFSQQIALVAKRLTWPSKESIELHGPFFSMDSKSKDPQDP